MKLNNRLNGFFSYAEIKGIFFLLFPIFIASAASYCSNLIDYFWVKSLSLNVAAIIALINGNIIAYLYILSRDYENSFLALYSKTKELKKELIFIQFIYLGIAAGIIITSLLIYFKSYILNFLSHGNLTDNLTNLYFILIIINYPITIISVALSAYLRANKDTKTPAKLELFAVILNTALDPILIFGILGKLKFGLLGLAFSALIAKGFYLIFIIKALKKQLKRNNYEIKSKRINISCQKRLLHVFIPSALMSLLAFSSYAFIYGTIAIFGIRIITAYGIGLEFLVVGYILLKGISVIFIILLGQALSTNKNIQELFRSIFFISSALIIILSAFYYFGGDFLSHLLIKDAVSAKILKTFLFYSPIFLVSYFARLIMSNCFQVLEKAYYPLVINSIFGWGIVVPSIYLAIHHFHYDIFKVFILLGILNGIKTIIYMAIINILKNHITKTQSEYVYELPPSYTTDIAT